MFCLSLWEANSPAVGVFFSGCTALGFPVSLLSLSLNMAVHLVLALLALASLSVASTPDCKELIKPLVLEDHTEIYGKWVYVMGSADQLFFQNALRTLQSSWIDLSATSDHKAVTLRWGDRIDGKCIVGSTIATINGTTSTVQLHLSEHKGHYLETCPDCLLWSDTTRNGDVTGRYLLLFTRTGQMDPTYLDTYRKQAECLNFPDKHHSYDGKTELCHDDKEKEATEEEESTEEKTTEEKTTEKLCPTEELCSYEKENEKVVKEETMKEKQTTEEEEKTKEETTEEEIKEKTIE
uniref:Apolipoprotein M n=1 Tax=Esox lucius TaxID=8010 RepID=A0AAY5KEE4_ESOLU